ncbi:MAG: protein kinase [Polyangiales bacterium]
MAESSRSSNPDDPEGLVGSVVQGKYRITDVLGAGGMGRIYRAEQMPLGRPVALKVLHQELDAKKDKGDFQKRFLLEAATCAKLTHPNIVVVYDYGRLEEVGPREAYFMAMEFVEGQTLHEALAIDGPFAPARAMRLAREIARGLREAHRQGAVHRDLKPSNVMLTQGGEGEGVKVLDFGLVKLIRDDSEVMTREDVFIGSPRYMAPEQIHRAPVDGRADLYALGVILYQMLTGHVPFEGDNPVQTLMGHVNEPVPPLRLPAGVEAPPGLEALVMRCLEKDPDRRFPNADTLIRALQDVAGGVLASGESSYSSGIRSGEIPADPPTAVGKAKAMRAAATPTPSPAVEVASEPTAPSGPSTGVKIGIFVGAIAIGGAAAFFALRKPPAAETPVAEVATPTQPAEPTGPSEPTNEEPPAARTFTLFVESTPTGAALFRGDERLGTTPTNVLMDADALGSEPARFRLELPGHDDYAWTQGPAAADVTVRAELQARRSASTMRRSTMASEMSTAADVMIKTSR